SLSPPSSTPPALSRASATRAPGATVTNPLRPTSPITETTTGPAAGVFPPTPPDPSPVPGTAAAPGARDPPPRTRPPGAPRRQPGGRSVDGERAEGHHQHHRGDPRHPVGRPPDPAPPRRVRPHRGVRVRGRNPLGSPALRVRVGPGNSGHTRRRRHAGESVE